MQSSTKKVFDEFLVLNDKCPPYFLQLWRGQIKAHSSRLWQRSPVDTMPILRSRKQEVLTHAFLSDQYANSGNAKIEADAWQRWIDLHRPWNVTDSVEDVTSGSLGCVISLTHQLGVESGMALLSCSPFLSEQTDDSDHHALQVQWDPGKNEHN